jgi:hypothetical protein
MEDWKPENLKFDHGTLYREGITVLATYGDKLGLFSLNAIFIFSLVDAI